MRHQVSIAYTNGDFEVRPFKGEFEAMRFCQSVFDPKFVDCIQVSNKDTGETVRFIAERIKFSRGK